MAPRITWAALLLFLPALYLSADEVRVETFSLNIEGRVISATLSLTPKIPQPVVERIRGGLPVVFTYRFTLKEATPHWRDKKIQKTRVSVTCKYDPVRIEYHLDYHHKGELVDSKVVHHWQEAVTAMTNLRRWEIFTVTDDAVKITLYVEARTHLLARTKWLIIPDDISTDVETSSHFIIYE